MNQSGLHYHGFRSKTDQRTAEYTTLIIYGAIDQRSLQRIVNVYGFFEHVECVVSLMQLRVEVFLYHFRHHSFIGLQAPEIIAVGNVRRGKARFGWTKARMSLSLRPRPTYRH